MGDYNVTCALSNLSIKPGESVYFIPLVDSFLYTKDKKERFSRIDVSDEWCPSCIPLVGVYDGYGKVDLDERSQNFFNSYNEYIQDKNSLIFADKSTDRVFSGCFILKDFAQKLIDNKKITEFYSGFDKNYSLVESLENHFKETEEYALFGDEEFPGMLTDVGRQLLKKSELRRGWEYGLRFYGSRFLGYMFVNLFGDWRQHKEDILLMSQLGFMMFLNKKMWRPQINGEQPRNSRIELIFGQTLTKFVKERKLMEEM